MTKKQSDFTDDFAKTLNEYTKLETKLHGCFSSLFIVLFASMFIGVYFIGKNEYKKNKKHVNVISDISEKDKKIVILDINTGKERTIDYNGYGLKSSENYEYLPTFQEAVKMSKIGDTVVFISPCYDKQNYFELGRQNKHKNTLYLNMDSVFDRKFKQKER